MLECGKFKFHIETFGIKKKQQLYFSLQVVWIQGCNICLYRELTVDVFTNYRKKQNSCFWVRERYGTYFTKETKESVGILSDVYFIVNKPQNINA